MRIGILGSGLMGGKLGTVLARAGHEVVFSYSRSVSKLQRLAKEAGGKARAGTVAEAAAQADALLLAVHWARVDEVLAQTGSLAGQILLTCSLPMSEDDTHLVIGQSSSGAEALAAKLPRAHVISAFGTVPSEVLYSVFARRRKRSAAPHLVYCGDHQGAKRIAARLIRDTGFTPLDVGPLSIARYLEPFTLLIAQIAYYGKGGPELAYRFEHFPKQRTRRGRKVGK
jgi:8-hydroxy-5-deazaflavin:NADPH oxidoreductase